MNFFKSKVKTPSELVRLIKDNLSRLDLNGSANVEVRKKTVEDISKHLYQVKVVLYGDGDQEVDPNTVSQLAIEIYSADLLGLLVINLWKLEFEARKDVCQIFNILLRRQIGTRLPTVDYLATKEDVIFSLLRGYENPEIALNTGLILRELLRHEQLARVLLYSEQFYLFFGYIEQTTFGIACDAMANFKDTLTKHKPIVAEYLEKNYDRFFTAYNALVQSNNYVTKRQSLKLLGEILLDRSNFTIMTKYIAEEDNLKMMMNLLRDKSKNIQFEAFHVFKVFVANPKKPPQIEAILRRNKEKLIGFLQNFHNDKEDEQFSDEKAFLLNQIQKL
ncbi:Mo25-like protein [Atractiella rhizophila]|nr:Mo25-like protein [Atractiella rhizophila]